MKIYVSEEEIIFSNKYREVREVSINAWGKSQHKFHVEYNTKLENISKDYGSVGEGNLLEIQSLEQHDKELLQEFQTKLVRAIVDKSRLNNMPNLLAFFVDEVFEKLLKERGAKQ